MCPALNTQQVLCLRVNGRVSYLFVFLVKELLERLFDFLGRRMFCGSFCYTFFLSFVPMGNIMLMAIIRSIAAAPER